MPKLCTVRTYGAILGTSVVAPHNNDDAASVRSERSNAIS